MLIVDLIKYNGHIPFNAPIEAFIYYFVNVIALIFCYVRASDVLFANRHIKALQSKKEERRDKKSSDRRCNIRSERK